MLAFTDYNNPETDLLDDLSVTPLATTTPEPSTWALVGGGLVGLAGVTARSRRDATA